MLAIADDRGSAKPEQLGVYIVPKKSDSATLFPNILQPATALKAYAPIGVKFWENQETALDGLKEFADGWFARRRKSTQAA
jgi:hypothetical protein